MTKIASDHDYVFPVFIEHYSRIGETLAAFTKFPGDIWHTDREFLNICAIFFSEIL